MGANCEKMAQFRGVFFGSGPADVVKATDSTQYSTGFMRVPPMRRLIAALVAVVLVAPVAHAQRTVPSSTMSDKQKAAIVEKRARAKEIDEAYKATIKQMPDKQQTTDPWGNLRAPSGK